MRCETLPSPAARVALFAKALLRDRSGATSLEYGLICVLIFLSIVGSVTYFSDSTNAMYTRIVTSMP